VARLTPENLQRARDLIALYPEPRSALIPILHVLQEQDGYLSPDGMGHVGELLGLTTVEVQGTASFYDMFHLEPVGKYLVAVCTNIACMLQGAYRLLDHAEERLEVAPGETTADGLFTLEDAECLALCGNAPCITVNWRFFGDLDLEGFDALIEDLRTGRLDDEVPPHGTLSRLGRTVGLQAGPAIPVDGVMAAAGAAASVGSPEAGQTAQGSPVAKAVKAGRATKSRGKKAAPPEVPPAVAAAHPHVDLDTRRTTAATLSMDGAHLRERP
jgi:NADH-quinone oxidoreductase subunit E